MTANILFSQDTEPFDWSEAETARDSFGTKGALLATLPRLWTPLFALISATLAPQLTVLTEFQKLGNETVARLKALAGADGKVIVRSSIVGESIWDRGKYKSVTITADSRFEQALSDAVAEVISSAPGKQVALVVQRYVEPKARGEFGNLLRVSKTRDHWELSTTHSDRTTTRSRFNTQRDAAASAGEALVIRPGVPQERVFGSVGAWLNNQLHRGRPQRVNCEWLTDTSQIFVVQLDEEGEDYLGVNPFQIRVAPAHIPSSAEGQYLRPAEGTALAQWDKLKVLEELWESDASHKPRLFFIPLSNLPTDVAGRNTLASEFRSLIGENNIVVRTSVVAGGEKTPNLPRTECLDPAAAAEWCIAEARKLKGDLSHYAFVAHRFMAAKSSAWVRAEPDNPVVEIHSLWGLPDALQYCSYDIWEVHAPTQVATEYPEYKSNILLPTANGGWEYVRVKNELARHLSIGRREALDLATRTAAIAARLGRACHVMWFVGCVDPDGIAFNVPWYWTEAHKTDRNLDRSNYKVVTISDPMSLSDFVKQPGSRYRQAIELKPTDIELMRDTEFIDSVGRAAATNGVPVILAGSTLAHAYYQLQRTGCSVVTSGEKEFSRVRRNTMFGKLVRDKIPARISQRRESEVTRKVPSELRKAFLISKLLEEALEVRTAVGPDQKALELADVYEIVRALAQAENLSIEQIAQKAEEKRGKAGGFDDGLVLLQTGILGSRKETIQDSIRLPTQVLARRISEDTYEIPFSFFGFMELDQPRSISFEHLGTHITIVLKSDRLELRAVKTPEQLELPLDLSIEQDSSES